MEKIHTPGPWRVFNHRAPLGETGDYEIYVMSGKQTVCYCNEIGEDEEEVSNANLIACAPEMLEALQTSNSIILALLRGQSIKNLDEAIAYNASLIQKATQV